MTKTQAIKTARDEVSELFRIKRLGKNKTLITYNVTDPASPATRYEKDVYFSYGEPVVIVDWFSHQVYATAEKYSRTTSKHANEFMRLSGRFDYESDGSPVVIPRWTFIEASTLRMYELAAPKAEPLTKERRQQDAIARTST